MRAYIPKDARLLPKEAQKVFTGEIFEVYQWQQPMFDGSMGTFEMLRRPDTVKAFAVKDNQLVILEQEQPVLGFFYDIPGGRNDFSGETEFDAVKRETEEETGMTFSSWKLISCVQPHSKIDWLVYMFVAHDFLSGKEQVLESGEKITVTLRSFSEVKELAHSPEARHIGADILDRAGSLEALINLPDITKA